MFTFAETFAQQAFASELFAGGLALGAIGAAIGALHVIWQRARVLASRRWTASVTIDNHSIAHRHIYVWLDEAGVFARARQLRGTGVRICGREIFAPHGHRHWFVRDGRICIFARRHNERARVSVGRSQKALDEVTITVLFGRPDIVRRWIAEGAALCRERERAGPGLHVLRGDWWAHISDLPIRKLDSVLSDDDRIDRLAEDMRWFFASEDWYRQRGVPWRRGYLLYGPPGTGKSSVIRALASDLRRDIATVPLSSPSLTDEDLRDGMVNAPRGAMIVLEDIDAAFRQREAGEAARGITFSGLLNAIDGVAAQEGRVLVMTTNHRDALDPALIRPGRADMQVELGPVGACSAKALFRRFFPDEEALAERFAERLGDRLVTPAELQGWLLAHASDPDRAADAAGLIPAEKMAAE